MRVATDANALISLTSPARDLVVFHHERSYILKCLTYADGLISQIPYLLQKGY